MGGRPAHGAHGQGRGARQVRRRLHHHRSLHRGPRPGRGTLLPVWRRHRDRGRRRLRVPLPRGGPGRRLRPRRQLAHVQPARRHRGHAHACDRSRTPPLLRGRLRGVLCRPQGVERGARGVPDLAPARVLARQVRLRVPAAARGGAAAGHRGARVVLLRDNDRQHEQRGRRSVDRPEALVLLLDTPPQSPTTTGIAWD